MAGGSELPTALPSPSYGYELMPAMSSHNQADQSTPSTAAPSPSYGYRLTARKQPFPRPGFGVEQQNPSNGERLSEEAPQLEVAFAITPTGWMMNVASSWDQIATVAASQQSPLIENRNPQMGSRCRCTTVPRFVPLLSGYRNPCLNDNYEEWNDEREDLIAYSVRMSQYHRQYMRANSINSMDSGVRNGEVTERCVLLGPIGRVKRFVKNICDGISKRGSKEPGESEERTLEQLTSYPFPVMGTQQGASSSATTGRGNASDWLKKSVKHTLRFLQRVR